jgi:hypothetical protein
MSINPAVPFGLFTGSMGVMVRIRALAVTS